MRNAKTLIFSLLAVSLMLYGCEQELSIHEPGNLVPRTVDQDLSVPSIHVNGAQFHAEAFGDPNDPMIVVIHGGPGSDYRYLQTARSLRTRDIV